MNGTCPYRKPKMLTRTRESVDSSLDERSFQTDLVWLDRTVPVAGCVRSRNPSAHQLNILRRATPKRVALGSIDRLVFVGLYHLAPGVLEALKIVTPETLIRWHRIGFRGYWRWKSRPRGGRRKTPTDIRNLIHEMSMANPLWGAPRIHGE